MTKRKTLFYVFGTFILLGIGATFVKGVIDICKIVYGG